MTAPEPYYLALDPGHDTGWATFAENGDSISMGTCRNRQQVYELLATRPKTIIAEDWITKKGVKLGGDRLETVRVLGVVEYYCFLTKTPLYQQPNTIKSIGYLWAGLDKPTESNPRRHQMDAYVHGVHFLQKRGIRKPQHGA